MKRVLPWFLLFLCLPFASRAAPSDVFLSEIAWAGSSASTADEWLELANAGDEPVDLSGWTVEGAGSVPLVLPDGSVVPPRGTFLIANYPADEPRSTLDAAPDWVTTAVSLSNSTLRLVLRDASGTAIDAAGDGGAPFAGTSGGAKASMERVWPRLAGTSAEAWRASEMSLGFDAGAAERGSPGIFAFTAPEPAAEAPTGAEAASSTPEIADTADVAGAPTYPATAARLCEIFPSPASGQEEWVELCNPSSVGELLEGWTLEDGSGASTPLSGLLLPYGRTAIRSPKGKLNNGGDLVRLKHPSGRVIDAVAYGSWEEGPYRRGDLPSAGEALMREELGDAWRVTATPTPGGPNVFVAPASGETEDDGPAPARATPSARTPAVETVPSPPPPPPAPQAIAPSPAPAASQASAPQKPRVKAAARKTAPLSRYKGSPYAGVVAVPPGVHAKSRAYVLIGDALEELRFSSAPPQDWPSGLKISFVAQRKTDDAGAYLLANPNSVRQRGVAAIEAAPASSWPDQASKLVLRGTVAAQEARTLRIEAGGRTGVVHLAAAPAAALAAGDEVEVRGVAAPGEPPRLYADSATSLRLVASFRAASAPTRPERFPAVAAWTLFASAAGFGLFSYLRRERLKRLAVSGAAPFEALDE